MDEKVTDSVFGEMTYKHSWSRMQMVDWWGTCNVKITAHAYTGQEIIEKQRNAYLDYQKNIKRLLVDATSRLIEYNNSSYNLNSPISQNELLVVLHPKTVLFHRDGSWGVLFDSDWDTENGIGIFKENGVVKVGTQDEFL